MMMCWRKQLAVGASFLLTLILAALSLPATAADVAKVRVGLETQPPVWVGQKVAFYVDLMSPTFFSGTPIFDLPAVPGVVLMKVDARPVMGSEQVDGATYSIQRHEFVLFAHRAGSLVVPAFRTRFAIAPGVGQPPVEQQLMTEPLQVEVEKPPGAEDLSMLISTTELNVDDTWSPALGDDHTVKLQVGDALTRTIKLRAADVPGMMFPPIQFRSQNGLGVYPKSPSVEDSTQRGDFTGQRIETVTYLCEKAGTYTLPALSIPWFDVDDEQLKRVDLPAVTVEVVANPRFALDSTPSEASQPRLGANAWWWIGGTVFVTVVAALLGWWFHRALAMYLSDWRTRRAESEAAYFARLKAACQSENPAAILDALTRWIDRVYDGDGVTTIEQFVRDVADDELRRQTEQLERQLFAVPAPPHDTWSGATFYQRIATVRQQLRQGKTRAAAHSSHTLPPLNP